MYDTIPKYKENLCQLISNLNNEGISEIVDLLDRTILSGKRIYVCGNGGSAGSASHFIADLNKGAKSENFFPRGICLNDNIPTMMAVANDISYEEVFVYQLENHIEKDDVLIGISGSGNSMNVINAINYANENDGITIGLCGYDGGKLKKMSQKKIHIESFDMQKVEDCHMIICHIIMQQLCMKRK